MPNMICLAGMPGVGKTTWAMSFLKNHPDYHYFSPDQYYVELNGDDTNRANTFEVWMEMFHDINAAMKLGYNVLIDSDNLTFHQRTQWPEWFPEFTHILVFFEASWDTCYNQMMKRRRKLPYSVMIRKWEKWQRPTEELDGQFWKYIYKGHHNMEENNE